MSAPFLKFPFRYDPKTDMWTAVASMSISRDAVGSVCLVINYMLLEGMMDRLTLIQWRLMIPRQMSGPRWHFLFHYYTYCIFVKDNSFGKTDPNYVSIKIHSISKIKVIS